MGKNEFQDWVNEIKEKLPLFLKKLQVKNNPGFFKYSLSGDYWSDKFNWGLGNAVFALKNYYTINHTPDNLGEIINFINQFQRKNGYFYDSLVKRTSLPIRIYNAIKSMEIDVMYYNRTKRAETRQSLCVLKLFDKNPPYEYKDFPHNTDDISKFISKLHWNMPWGTAAQFGGLIFFIATSNLSNKTDLLEYCFNWISKLQKEDGCWYTGKPKLNVKINGAMKVFTAVIAAKHFANYDASIFLQDKIHNLIDTILLASNEDGGCDNFNITFALKYSNSIAKYSYRYEEIEKFLKKRLDIYKKYYHNEYGAFSFNVCSTERFYYGMPISKCRNEPDVHGTMMFLWGLSVIGDFWQLNDKLNIREHVA